MTLLENERCLVATFYKFAVVFDCESLIERVKDVATRHGTCGTVLIAEEGVNGTIAGSRLGVDAVLALLRCQPGMADLKAKESYAVERPFDRMKVKRKKEIVTMGVDDVDPVARVGTYVAPADWNRLLDDPEVVLIDTRNDYEYRVGTFEGAVNPRTRTFRAFPAFVRDHLDPVVHKKVAMFCTGGIRCEKASAFVLGQGFRRVYHLQGGILNYLEKIPAGQSRWRGECYVFDGRVALNHELAAGSYAMCLACGHPIDANQMSSPQYEKGVSCPLCFGR